jgi:hypothetical protein
MSSNLIVSNLLLVFSCCLFGWEVGRGKGSKGVVVVVRRLFLGVGTGERWEKEEG